MKTKHVFDSKRHWQIWLLANTIMEVACTTPWEINPLLREWKITRYVDYTEVTLQ